LILFFIFFQGLKNRYTFFITIKLKIRLRRIPCFQEMIKISCMKKKRKVPFFPLPSLRMER